MKKFISLLFAACMSVCAFADLQGTSTEASQFSFTDGYNYHLSTSAAGVVCEFELLDDKVGVVAYVWDYTNGFKEHMMTNVEGKQFTYTLKGYAAGTFVHVACKFAFAGGMAVTQDFFYEVETVQGEDGEPIVEPTGWDAIDWVPGSGEKYKVDAADGQNVVNIQSRSGHQGIYTHFPNAISDCSLPEGMYEIQGAGIWLFLDAFEDEYTEVTVTCGGQTYTFTVYYADGSSLIAEGSCTGSSIGVDGYYTAVDPSALRTMTDGYSWEVTNNEEGVVNIEMTVAENLPGMNAAQLMIFDEENAFTGQYIDMVQMGSKFMKTMADPYKRNDKLIFLVKVQYTDHVMYSERIGFTVGGSCFEVPQVEIPEPQPETALENVQATSTMKQLVDGHLYIYRAGAWYDALGRVVK